MDKKSFIMSQKDCASLLGQSYTDYNKGLKKIKVSRFNKNTPEKQKEKELLKKLGLCDSDLKKRVI